MAGMASQQGGGDPALAPQWRWHGIGGSYGGIYEVAAVPAVAKRGASCQMSVRMGSASELTPFLIG